MKLENKIGKPSNTKKMFNVLSAKSVAISVSLLLGACATTGDKSEPKQAAKQTPAKQSVQVKKESTEPSAAELMKSLKAPLVEPPEVKEVAVKVAKVEPAPVPVVVEADKKVVSQALKKQDGTKVVLPLTEDVKLKVAETAVVEQEQIAQETAEKPQSMAAVVTAKPFNVSAKKLPFTYDIWTIRQGNTPLTKGLVIATPTWEMGKEGYTSQIWLTMMEDKIHVNSSSDIETASRGLGIRIDGGDLIPFSSISDNNIGVIKGKWLDTLAAANKVDIYLGFFPGKKPTSETFSSNLSLDNLSRVVATYRVLN